MGGPPAFLMPGIGEVQTGQEWGQGGRASRDGHLQGVSSDNRAGRRHNRWGVILDFAPNLVAQSGHQ